eukprot:9323437-Pyramimonas_sp.AAC.1
MTLSGTPSAKPLAKTPRRSPPPETSRSEISHTPQCRVVYSFYTTNQLAGRGILVAFLHCTASLTP